MKLDPMQQAVLLELANTERSLDVVGDKAFVTPEQQEVDRLTKEQQRMLNASAAAQMAVDDMEAEILRIQEDERKLRKRAADDKAQLAAETDPERRRDLEHDRYSAKSRIADLMGELTECHNQIHALRNNRDNHGAKCDEIARQLEAAKRAADAANEAAAAVQDPEAHIAELRAQLPETVLAEYDAQNDSDVAADFNGRTCGGTTSSVGPDQQRINRAPPTNCPSAPSGTYLIRKQV